MCLKIKYVYSDHGIAFGSGSWSFGNDFARNVVIFGVNNSSSSHIIVHTDNHINFLKYNFYKVLDEGLTNDTYGSAGVVEKKLVSILVKQKQNFV